MDMNTDIKFDDAKYNSDEFDRTTSAPSHNSTTIIKYITPRVIAPNVSNSFQGSSGSLGRSNVNTNYPTTTTTTTTHGLASLIQTPRFSTISSIHSINGERIIDELRELSRVTETLGNTILQYCTLEAHNRAQELQIEWLETHSHENSLIIEKKFQTEMESAQKLINQSSNQKSILETKLNEASRTTIGYDEQYQQLLSKRNISSKDLFDLERQIAQNNAESQFLQRLIRSLDDETKFYILKNRILYDRKVRLRYELDDEIFSQQSLKMELEVLENEKITNEDIHLTSFDDVHNSIDISQIAGMQPSKYFSQQLTNEVQRIRDEYEKKIEIYREELHRKFELELHRYQIHKSSSLPIVSREHELKLEQYQHENNDILQQIAAIRGCTNQIIIQIETIEKQIMSEKNDQQSIFHRKKHLDTLNQLIKDRERQLEDVFRIRNSRKEEIDNYKKRLNRYSRDKTKDYYNKRASIHEINHSSNHQSISRLSLQELPNENNEQTHIIQHPKRSSLIQIDELWEEGTLTRFADFNIDQDCDELHRLLTNSNIDEVGIIRILCNRSIGQRLQIRDRYKNLFNQNLGDVLERIINKNLNKLLRILLLSPIERDCFELRRILKGLNIDINILVEIFFARSNKHLQTLKDTYQKLFKNTLEQDIIGDGNNPSKRIFVTLLQSNRPEDNDINDNEILKDAQDLYGTQSKWNTDGSIFIRLLCNHSNIQLKQIFEAYQQFSEIDIEQAIQIYTDLNLHHTLLAIVRIIRNRPQFFAYELKNSIKDTITNIDNLNRIIVSRCEIDMVQIKSEYNKLVKRTLYDHIQMDTNGNYKRALLELIRQRIEQNAREFVSKRSEEPLIRITSDISIKRPFARSTSDHTVNLRRQDNENNQFDSNNQLKSNSLSTINIKQTQSNRRSFIPMATTDENNSQLNNDEE